jgi:hypothetical protein
MNLGVIVNSSNYDHCPELVGRFRDRGDELIGHGISNGTERPIDMTESAEREMILDVTNKMLRLAEAGYEYLLDWGLCDEQPFWMSTENGKILSIPYPIELNDQPAIVGRRNTASEYADTLIDQFDELMRVSVKTPIVMSISLHTFIMGQPFRINHLRRALDHILARRNEIWVTRPKDIMEYYKSLTHDRQPNKI